jgi:hypothetical protein
MEPMPKEAPTNKIPENEQHGAVAEPLSRNVETANDLHNFTPRAQQALALARKEADRLNHNFVGTEHVLLGLIKLGQGVAVNVLGKLGLDLETVRAEVEKQVGTGPEQKITWNLPYTPRVKKVIALAEKEKNGLNHTYLGTEHILLGLLREGDGVAAKVMRNLGVDLEETRKEILRELDPNFSLQADKFKNKTPEETIMPSPNPEPDSIDTNKRYDVYCTERNQEVVVYRNARFKGLKRLYQTAQYDIVAQFIELEQADGQTIFLSRTSIIKFCEHGLTPSAETISTKKL